MRKVRFIIRGSDAVLEKGADPQTATRAQLEAGNYQKTHRRFAGFGVTIESPAGSVRHGVDSNGTPWETKMVCDYGYIKGSLGVDGDHLDVFLGPDEDADTVYIVHQRDPGTGLYDEDKCMLGFASQDAAVEAYCAHYDCAANFFGAVTPMPLARFREVVRHSRLLPAVVPEAGAMLDRPAAAQRYVARMLVRLGAAA